ncbi:hypothetical protein K439DRAFT_1624036 [Ramaria rubella]|nr:hypothetical protein K439DRAFT_1624036 [Ramaria rubella]
MAQSIQSTRACALPELQSAEATSACERGGDMDVVNDFEGLQGAEKVIVRGEAEGDKVNVVHRRRAEGNLPQKGGQGFMGKGNRVQVESLDPCAASPKNEGPEAAIFELFRAVRVIVGGEDGQSAHQGGCEGAEQRSLQGETAQSIQSARACVLPELQSTEATSTHERGGDMDAVNDFKGLQVAEKVIVRGEAEGDKVNVVHRHRAEGGLPQKGGQGFMGKGNRVQVESLDPCAAGPKNEGPEAAVFELFRAVQVIIGGKDGQSAHQGGVGGEGFQQLRTMDSF